jgi:hypothetical protein
LYHIVINYSHDVVQGYYRLADQRNSALAEVREAGSLSLAENLTEERLSLGEKRPNGNLSLAETKSALVCLARKFANTIPYSNKYFTYKSLWNVHCCC